MNYRFREKTPTLTKAHITRRLALSVYLLPILILLILLTGTTISNRTLMIAPASSSAPVIDIISPLPNTVETGAFQLAARLSGQTPDAYDMFWYVDNGQWNWMSTSAGGGNKQADIDVSSWHWHQPSNDYTITLVAVLHDSGQRIYSGVPIQVGTAQQAASIPAAHAAPLSTSLFVNPDSSLASAAAGASDPTLKRVLIRMAATPTAIWLGGWNQNVEHDVSVAVSQAAAAKQTPVLVTYNIPDRDCGGYSNGGATTPDAYKAWIQAVATGISKSPAIVILEPDATAQTVCLSASDLATRNQLLAFAVTTLKANAATHVYVDAGNPTWITAADMAGRLQAAGVAKADGFSLNVSNFIATSDNVAYGTQVSKLIGNKHFVIDTSRNGKGSNGEWCNPSGRALGAVPTANTGNPLIDYLLWVKTPGESDGTCNGGPAAGVLWPAYAESLALNAGW